LQNKTGTVALTSDIPVKATGTEVDTGTDDAKFVTAKALTDSDYMKEVSADGKYLLTGLSNYPDIGNPASDDTFLMLTSADGLQGLTVESLLKYLDTIYVRI
jgi:hypothetical protein